MSSHGTPHLALPSPTPSSSALPTKKPIGKKRRRPRPSGPGSGGLDQTRDLDENDDISDSDIVAAPQVRRRAGSESSSSTSDAESEGAEEDKGKGKGGGGREIDESGRREEEGREVQRQRHKRMKEVNLLRGVMDAEQGRRYDAFYSVILPKQAVHRINRDVYDQHINPSLSQVVAGLGKIFVAEIVELAREVQAEQKMRGPLRPEHLKIAKKRWDERTHMSKPKPLFRG